MDAHCVWLPGKPCYKIEDNPIMIASKQCQYLQAVIKFAGTVRGTQITDNVTI